MLNFPNYENINCSTEKSTLIIKNDKVISTCIRIFWNHTWMQSILLIYGYSIFKTASWITDRYYDTYTTSLYKQSQGSVMVVGFTTTCGISTYHH